MRFAYLRKRLPQLQGDDYQRLLSIALHEQERDTLRAFRDLDARPFLIAKLTVSQSLTANTLTTTHFDSVTDTHGWWNTSTYTYTPTEVGFYRCSWAANLLSSAALPASTYGLARAGGYETFQYGNGSGLDVDVSGSAILDLDGATGVKLEVLLLTGTTPSINGTTPSRTWLCIDYLGRRAI